jgi:hypothetical protein
MALLDDIAGIVGTAIVGAGMTRDAVLTKTTSGTRIPGALTRGTNPTTQDFAAQGIVQDKTRMLAAGTLLADATRVIRLFASTIEGGAEPMPGDRITIEDETSVIVAGGVNRDPAAATFVCQCK